MQTPTYADFVNYNYVVFVFHVEVFYMSKCNIHTYTFLKLKSFHWFQFVWL